MVYKHNYIPYIAPVCLQNATLNSDRYIIADKVLVGSNVDSDRTSGEFVIEEGGNLEIEAYGDVELRDGFVVESGGIVTINTKGNVNFNGGIVMPGGTLNVNGKTITMSLDFIVEKGGVLNLQ